MDTADKVSVIMPMWNDERFVREAIESVIAQTYMNWELLITDDCSSDKSCDIAKEYAEKDSRIQLFKLDKNSGAGIARNNSIRQSTGRYMAFLDADDMWIPEKLEKQLEFIRKNNYKFIHASRIVINEDGKILGKMGCAKKVSFFNLLTENSITCQSVLYDIDFFGRREMPIRRKRQDWGMWLKLLKECKYAYGQQEPLVIYRKRNGSLSSNKLKMFRENWSFWRNEVNLSPIKTLFVFSIFLPRHICKLIKFKIGV